MTWSQLKPIAGSLLARLSILAPLLGHIILINEFTLSLGKIAPDLFLSGSERVYFVYYGLVFIGLSAGIFQICCPRRIAHYDSDRVATQAELSIATAERLNRLIIELTNFDSSTQASAPYAVNSHTRDRFAFIADNEARIIDVITRLYALDDMSRPIARWCSSGAFIVGSIALLIPSLFVMVAVTWQLVTAFRF